MTTKITDLRVEELSIVDRPANKGARVLLLKHDHRKDLQDMSTLTESIVKALRAEDADTDRERAEKALVRKQLEQGVVKAEAVAADLLLRAHATEIRKSEPTLTREQAYVRAINLYPDVAVLAIGN